MKTRILLLLGICCVLMSSCGRTAPQHAASRASATPPLPTVLAQRTEAALMRVNETLAENERRWKALQIADYRVSYSFAGAFSYRSSVSIDVRSGRADLATYQCQSSRSPLDCQRMSSGDWTIEGAFATARRDLNHAYCITEVRYDVAYHFPSAIICGESKKVTDYAHSLYVSAFAPLS